MKRPAPAPEQGRPPEGSPPDLWRSLEARRGDPSVRDFLEREFQDGAAELPEGVSRRSLVTLVGASLGLAGLAGCRRPIERIVPFAKAPEQLVPGVPRWYATTMPFSHDAFGLLVESHEGRPTKIEGNELHPSTRGSSSAFVQASILDLYDPDRSQHTMRRVAGEAGVAGEARGGADHGGPAPAGGAAGPAPTTGANASLVAAWGALEGTHAASGGAQLGVLTTPHSSPSQARLEAELRTRFPRLRLVAWEPISDENIAQGTTLATGRALAPTHHFDRARVIVALDSDFLLLESDAVANARRYADGRRVSSTGDRMSRLYAFEAAQTVTGANADHRYPIRHGQVAAVVAALAARIGAGGASPGGSAAGAGSDPGVESAVLEAVAADLIAHRGESLLVAGRNQHAAVHAGVFALNAALGNVGQTVTYRDLPDVSRASLEGMRALSTAMAAGELTTLVILGGNPVYDAPADLDFAGALARVEHSIYLGSHHNETAAVCAWHVPAAHYLESWGDARAQDGTLSVVQPLIQPLYADCRSPLELLALLVTGAERAAHEVVQETWRSLLRAPAEAEADAATYEPLFAARFERVLHDGLLADSAVPSVVPALLSDALNQPDQADQPAGGAPQEQGLDLLFRPSPQVFDGRFANNSWLQELPHPITKMTWDNAALVSPQTAHTLGLENEDRVRLGHGGRELLLPLWIVPGQADDTVVVELGYGRIGGRIAAGAGASGYRLRASDGLHAARGATLEAAGGTQEIAQTQDHGSMEGRPLVREATLARYREVPDFARRAGTAKPHERSSWTEVKYDSGYQWGMTIDLNACIGCNACAVACQSENNVPVVGRDQVRRGREMHWLRIDRYFGGEPAAPQVSFQPVPCMHCENAPCEQVCPVAATVHDAEGLNTMVYNRCIGTRYCLNNCPYKVRRFNYYNYTKDTPQSLRLAANPEVTVRSRGVMEKCTYCVQRLNAGKLHAKVEGRSLHDGEVKTACQQACPANAIEFGNILELAGRVAQAKANERNYALLDELHVKPRTTYLAKLRNPNPALAGSDRAGEHPAPHEPAGSGDHGGAA